MDKYIPPFSITNRMVLLVSLIMEKIGQINSINNLSKYPVLRKQNRIKSIHSSCAIEANSLSFDQVSDVINGKQVTGPLKDILEVQNAIEAYNKIESVNPLSEENLKEIHKIIEKKVLNTSGQYRSGNEGVLDEKGNIVFVAPPSTMVPHLMSDLFTWLNKEYKNISPLILSSIFHYEFVFIHPFEDGNGRTARYWQTSLLGKWNKIFYWLPIENQIYKYQSDYYKAISESHVNGNSNVFVEFMLNIINKTLEELVDNTKQFDNAISPYVSKLLKVLNKNIWYTSNQILALLNLHSKESLRKNYINPAIENRLIEVEYPDKPTSKNQRYKKI